MNPRRLLHSLLLLTPLCALADPSATALRVPKAPTLVALETPASFRRHGVRISSARAILLEVEVPDRGEFVPRGITAPLILYGSGVCRILRSPILQPHADVLCPPLLPDDAAIIWLTVSGEAATLLDKNATADRQQKAAQAHRTAAVAAPVGAPVSYPDAKAVAKALPKSKAAHE